MTRDSGSATHVDPLAATGVTPAAASTGQLDMTPLQPPSFGGAAAEARVFAALFGEGGPPEPRKMGRFVVLGALGSGGMGSVLEAFDRSLDRRVALKVLHHGLALEHRERLVREAKAMARLSHPNVVQVYEVGEADGDTFIAMEYLRGQTLRAWCERAPSPTWRECLEVFLQAGEGLAAAHAEGVIHRDFKPSNAFIDERGRVCVLDFGLARQASDLPSRPPVSPDLNNSDSLDFNTPLTRTGAVLGTPAYMPLEQLMGEEADARSDQFSYCVALYEGLYGERPYAGSTIASLRTALVKGEPKPAPRDAAVPEALRRVLLRGLAREPAERWPSMEALLAALREQIEPRSRRWIALGAFVGVGLLGVGAARYAELAQRCAGARAQLEGVWDDATRHEVQTAIMATELSFAGDTWERVAARIDDYASAWTAKHTEVCESTTVRREQSEAVMDLRMACLQERRLALSEATAVLRQADAARVEGAVPLVASLPALARCDDLEALRAVLPPPEDPVKAAEVSRLRDELARARALDASTAYRDALAIAEPIVSQAEALGYAPLVAEALYQRARLDARIGSLERAHEDAERAYLLGAELRHDDVEVDAVTLLIEVEKRQGRNEAGLLWGKTATALARDPRRQAYTANYVGGVLLRLGRYDEALARARRARELGEGALAGRDPILASSLTLIGNIHQAKDELDAARERYEEARAFYEEQFGARSPSVAQVLNNIGVVLLIQGEYEQARAIHLRALEIREEALGADALAVAETLLNLGNVLKDLVRLEEAQRAYERALAIRSAAHGLRHPDVAHLQNNLALVLRSQGQTSAALELHRAALETRERTLGPAHPDVALSLDNIAAIHRERGEYEQAVALHRRALAIRVEAFGEEHRDVALSHYSIGYTLQKQGAFEDSFAELERALAIRERSFGPAHPVVATTINELANTKWLARELDEALVLHRRGLAINEELLGPRHMNVARSRFNIGLVLQDKGELDAAYEEFSRSLEIVEANVGPEHPNLGYPLEGLTELALKRHDLAAAKQHATRALTLLEAHEVAPERLARARFNLARALWPEARERGRARELAQLARDAYVALGEGQKQRLVEVEAWLTKHGGR